MQINGRTFANEIRYVGKIKTSRWVLRAEKLARYCPSASFFSPWPSFRDKIGGHCTVPGIKIIQLGLSIVSIFYVFFPLREV